MSHSQFLEFGSGPTGLSDRWAVGGVCVFLALLVWIVFGQTLRHGFVNFDDDVYVYKNAAVTGGLTSKGVFWAFTHVHSSNWHPLTWLSHMLDCQVYGLHPGGHHLTSVLLHTATAISLFLVFRQMTGALWRSAFVAAVFAIHPLHVESVAWVAERKDVLSGLFFVLTIGAYVRYARLPWSPARYALVTVLFALGLMCKPMLVTLPFVLLLLDGWPLNRWRIRAASEPMFRQTGWRVSGLLILEKLPWFAIAVASSAITFFAQGEAMSTLPLSARIGNAAVSYVSYLGQMFYPVGLSVFYPYPASGLAGWKIVAACFLLLGISTCAVACRKRPWFLFGWLWYLGMLIPAIGILQVGAQSHADRYTYLPQIGLSVLLTWGAADLCALWRYTRLVRGGLGVGILIILVFCARAQTSYWQNSESLWTHALTCTAANLTAHINLGNVLLKDGKADEAMLHYQQALLIQPDNADAQVGCGDVLIQTGKPDDALAHFRKALETRPDHAEAHNDLGNILAQKGNVDEAIAHFQKALRIQPDYAEARYNLGNGFFEAGKMSEAIVQYQRALQIRPDYAEASYNLGNTFSATGKLDEAITQYRRALQTKPDYMRAVYNLGTLLLQKGNVDEAITCFQKVLQINPNLAEAHYNLGSALFRHAKHREAITQLQQALQIKPGYAEAQNDLAWELATAPQASLRNGTQALALARQADQLAGGQDVDVLDTFAAAYAENGQFDAAIRCSQKAIALAQASGLQDRLAQLQSELKLYEAGLPFRQETQ